MPNGELTAAQLRYLASCIERYGADGCADITTRANIQVGWLAGWLARVGVGGIAAARLAWREGAALASTLLLRVPLPPAELRPR